MTHADLDPQPRPEPAAGPRDADASKPVSTGVTAAIRLDEYWPYQVTVLADIIARQTAAVVREHGGLNLSQWRVLAAIAEQPGRTAVDVVTVTPMDKGIVSRATKALLESGLLVRRASQSDGRVSHLFLTGKGSRLYQSLKAHVETVPEPADAILSPREQAAFCSLLKRLAKALPHSA